MTTGVGSFKSYQLSEGRTTPVPNRVSPTDQIRAEIDALFDGSRELGEVIEDVARLGARLIIQTAVEAEVEVFLGRARYQRAAVAEDARPGMRNGYCPATVKTTAGPVTVARPKLRGTTERFASALFGKSIARSNALESLVIAGFVRGLSVRDVENTLADALGAEAAPSKSAVSRICQAIGDEFTAHAHQEPSSSCCSHASRCPTMPPVISTSGGAHGACPSATTAACEILFNSWC
jgi:putative transposase